MATKEDPIISLSKSTAGKKNDLLHFKEETLRDFKQVQKKITDKYDNLDLEMREKIEAFEQRITTYENKIMELSNKINTDKTIREKVDNLMEFKEKADESMLTEKIRLDNFRNDLKSNVERIDKILTDSVIYPGIIGGISKYKTFHDLIDYLLSQTSQNLTFREKGVLDFKGYKTKLENTIASFNTQINTLLNTTSEFTKTYVQEAEERMKSIYNIYDDRLQDARIENANYAIGLEKATEVLKKELENLYVVKNELYEKVDKGMQEVKNDNTRVVKLFSGYRKNFHIMQHKFTQLSDFIKDIRFRINLKEDVQRREYAHMSNLINFDKKNQPGFYDGVYSDKLMKKGFGAQLKDYIEGRITADQLFRSKQKIEQKNIQNKSFGNDNISSRNNLNNINNNFPEEDSKFNFIDLFKESLKGKGLINKKSSSNYPNDIIKEENESLPNEEINPVLSKTVKDKNIFQKIINKKKEELKEEKKQDNSTQKKETEKDKEIIIKPKNEEEKIKIVSVNKEQTQDKDKESEKKPTDAQKTFEKKASMKNVLSNLFSVKELVNHLKKEPSENQPNDINKTDNKKQNQNRPMTVLSNKKNNNNLDVNPFKQINNSTIKEETDIKKPKTSHYSSIENRQEKKVKENIYNNTTINSLVQNIPPITSNVINKKSNSSNKKNVKYYVKPSNNANKGNQRAFSGIKKDDTKTFEAMFNSLQSYIPKNDLNMNENNNFLKKKK